MKTNNSLINVIVMFIGEIEILGETDIIIIIIIYILLQSNRINQRRKKGREKKNYHQMKQTKTKKKLIKASIYTYIYIHNMYIYICMFVI